MEIKIPKSVAIAFVMNLFTVPFMKYSRPDGSTTIGTALKALSDSDLKTEGINFSFFIFGFVFCYSMYELGKVLLVKWKARNQ